ncbi:MAG: hypothetical protein AABY64_05420 [Bdellovibrionota bacterium]
MIRIELFNKNGHLIKSFDFNGDQFKIGRALDCNLIIPDFSFRPIELTINKTAENKYNYQWENKNLEVIEEQILKIHNYKLVFTNLDFYANPNTQVSLKNRREWLYPLAVFVLIFLVDCFKTLFVSAKPYLSDQNFVFILAVGVLNLIFSFGLVLISKIINHEYNFWKILFYLMNLTFFIFVISTFGIRWFPFRLFENDLFWLSFNLAIAFPFFWKLTFLVCEHLEKKLKIILAFIPFVIFILFAVISTFPFQKKYKYSTYQPRPAVFQFLETKSISAEQLSQEIETEIE